MVSERYFLFGIEEMGIALDSIIKETKFDLELVEKLIQGIKSNKLPTDKLIDFLNNFLNYNILNVLINDKKIGEHIKEQFINKKGKKVVLKFDFMKPVLIEVKSDSILINIEFIDSLSNVPNLSLSSEHLIALFENNFKFLKFISLPPDNPLSINIPDHDREYLADLIVRIFLAVSTAILLRADLRNKIIKNIDSSIQAISSLLI